MKTPGRKRLDPSKPARSNRRNLSLTDADMLTAAAIGGGNASKGIRKALNFYRDHVMPYNIPPEIGVPDNTRITLYRQGEIKFVAVGAISPPAWDIQVHEVIGQDGSVVRDGLGLDCGPFDIWGQTERTRAMHIPVDLIAAVQAAIEEHYLGVDDGYPALSVRGVIEPRPQLHGEQLTRRRTIHIKALASASFGETLDHRRALEFADSIRAELLPQVGESLAAIGAEAARKVFLTHGKAMARGAAHGAIARAVGYEPGVGWDYVVARAKDFNL